MPKARASPPRRSGRGRPRGRARGCSCVRCAGRGWRPRFPWAASPVVDLVDRDTLQIMTIPSRALKTITGAGGFPGTYELAIDPERSTLDTAVTVAKRAEAARIDALFTADLLTFGAQGAIGSQEPLIFVAALSQVTRHAGLIATVSTTFHHPFNLARLFGTLDHVSNGRAAWNLVTSAIGEENYGPNGLPSPEMRYARAAETLDIVNALWDSWQPGALSLGPDGRAVLDRGRVRPIDHVGEHFTVAG